MPRTTGKDIGTNLLKFSCSGNNFSGGNLQKKRTRKKTNLEWLYFISYAKNWMEKKAN